MERKSVGEFWGTCKVFLWKIAKEKIYHRNRNLLLSVLPILMALTLVVQNDRLNLKEKPTLNDEIFAAETDLNKIFQEHLSNKIIYITPQNSMTEVISERLKWKFKWQEEGTQLNDILNQLIDLFFKLSRHSHWAN
jgi:hypothetical protein